MKNASNDFDFSKCFHFGMVQKNKMNIENFCLVLKQESRSKSNGWLMEHYANMEANEVLFYSAGLLASRCEKDSEVLIALQKSLIGDDGDVVPIDREFMGSILVATKESEKKQTINDVAIECLLAALDYPKGHLAMIKKKNATTEKGWIRSEWFSGSSNKGRLTALEDKVLRFEVLMAIDTIAMKSDRNAARNAICIAWDVSDIKLRRVMEDFTRHVQNPKLTVRSSNRQKADGDDLFKTCSIYPSEATPAATRLASNLLSLRFPNCDESTSTDLQSPLLLQTPILRRQERSTPGAPIEATPSVLLDDNNIIDDDDTAFEMLPAIILFREDTNKVEVTLQACPPELPHCCAVLNILSQDTSFSFNTSGINDDDDTVFEPFPAALLLRDCLLYTSPSPRD